MFYEVIDVMCIDQKIKSFSDRDQATTYALKKQNSQKYPHVSKYSVFLSTKVTVVKTTVEDVVYTFPIDTDAKFVQRMNHEMHQCLLNETEAIKIGLEHHYQHLARKSKTDVQIINEESNNHPKEK